MNTISKWFTGLLVLLVATTAAASRDDDDDDYDFAYAGLYNISTRALVQGGAEIAIGGFIIREDEELCVVIRGRGPSVQVDTTLLGDPKIEVYQLPSGTLIDTNDNWQDHPNSELLQASGLGNVLLPEEAGIFTCLPSGAYTVHLDSASEQYGVGIVEIIDVFFEDKAELYGWDD